MGYVRTNAPVKLGGGGGGSGTQDLPTHPSSISANGGNNHVTLTLEYSSTDLVDGVQINYKLDGYPTSPTDGEFVTENGAATSILIEGLTNSLTYYFRVFLYNEVDGVKYFQTDITNAQATCIPRAVEITGITPLVSAANHIVIVESGSGTISIPSGAKIILGSGASGTSGGFVKEVTVDNDINAQSFTATIASGRTASGTKFVVGDLSHDCGSAAAIVQSKWGPIGGNGGSGGRGGSSSKGGYDGDAGTGAGGGGGGGGGYYYWSSVSGQQWYSGGKGGKGGNSSGYGNKGTNGASGQSGWKPGGNGGNGGYAAGGGSGGGGGGSYDGDDRAENGSAGKSGTGIIVIQWDK